MRERGRSGQRKKRPLQNHHKKYEKSCHRSVELDVADHRQVCNATKRRKERQILVTYRNKIFFRYTSLSKFFNMSDNGLELTSRDVLEFKLQPVIPSLNKLKGGKQQSASPFTVAEIQNQFFYFFSANERFAIPHYINQ